jgi:hypothetical protein
VIALARVSVLPRASARAGYKSDVPLRTLLEAVEAIAQPDAPEEGCEVDPIGVPDGVGVERRGRLTRNVRFDQPRPWGAGRSEEEDAKAQGEAVCDSQAVGVRGEAAGQGQEGCAGVDGQDLDEFEARRG